MKRKFTVAKPPFVYEIAHGLGYPSKWIPALQRLHWQECLEPCPSQPRTSGHPRSDYQKIGGSQ